jgi:hypothetical protein
MAKRTCGDCDRLEDDEGVGYCRPPSTLWQVVVPVMHYMARSTPSENCECFKAKPLSDGDD